MRRLGRGSYFLRCVSTWIFVCALAVSQNETSGADASPSQAQQQRYRDLDSTRFWELTHAELAEYLALRTSILGDSPPVQDTVGEFALHFLGQRDYIDAKSEDLSQSNCVSFTNRCIALALSRSWDDFYRLYTRLSFKDGRLEAASRNHFTEADYIPNNSWILHNVSGDLGVIASSYICRTYRKQRLKALTEIGRYEGYDPEMPPYEEATIRFVGRDDLAAALPHLHTGDIALRVVDRPGKARHIDHMGIIVVRDSAPFLIHNDNIVSRVEMRYQLPLHEKILAGFAFLRVKPDARELAARELMHLRESLPSAEPEEVDRFRDQRQGWWFNIPWQRYKEAKTRAIAPTGQP